MSVIKIYQLKIEEQEKQLEKLRKEKAEFENDIVESVGAIKKLLNMLDIDLKELTDGNLNIANTILGVGKKLMFKQVKVDDFKEQFKDVTPIFEKYSHLIDKAQ